MEKEIELTCKLWADQIGSKHDMGDAVGNVFANLSSDKRSGPTQEQLENFKQALAKKLRGEVDKWGTGRRIMLLTDYNPCEILLEAANEAGIDECLIPIKSHTYTFPGHIDYCFGYSSKPERVEVNR
jgi:hypothetical protein